MLLMCICRQVDTRHQMVRVVEALTEVMKDHVMSGYDTVM